MNSTKMPCIFIASTALLACAAGAAAQETVLYSFSFQSSGAAAPVGGVAIDPKGDIYGTTENGGTEGAGAVFELSKQSDGRWKEEVLHSFSKSAPDGSSPRAPLALDSKGNLYGTTSSGGQNSHGIVFRLTPQSGGDWKETILYTFGEDSSDAVEPAGGVILDRNGDVFGARSGGSAGLGVIYELTPGATAPWHESVLFTFTADTTQGSYPIGELVFDAEGNLYGTGSEGGTHNFGIVFELSPQTGGTWQQSVLYNFGDADLDGVTPSAGLIMDRNGNLFGTTYGGGQNCAPGGEVNCGTLFELSQASSKWTETILHSFGQMGGDGVDPEAPVAMDQKGNLYGVTEFGGTGNAGAVYEVTRSSSGTSSERILHRFLQNHVDGYAPQLVRLVFDLSGNLVGTTGLGGTYSGGTVFEIANPDITAVPRFSVPAGTYTATQKVTISDYTPDAKIYYTTNGDEPSAESSDEYSGPIEVKKTETIKAIAVAKGLADSGLATAKYVIHLPTGTPEITPPSATYHALQKVTITDATNEAAIYYTTDGKTPTPISKDFYRGPFRISATTTIKAIAIAPGRSQSKVATDTITIHLPPGSAAEKIQP